MCLHNRKEYKTPIVSITGYKVFCQNTKGELYSPFYISHKIDDNARTIHLAPKFELNKVVQVQPDDKTFFFFEEISSAARIADFKSKDLDRITLSDNLVIRPVTGFEVIASGDFVIRSDDPQCLDGYYKSYECKSLIVHDNLKIAKDIDLYLVNKFLERQKHFMSYSQKKAFDRLLA